MTGAWGPPAQRQLGSQPLSPGAALRRDRTSSGFRLAPAVRATVSGRERVILRNRIGRVHRRSRSNGCCGDKAWVTWRMRGERAKSTRALAGSSESRSPAQRPCLAKAPTAARALRGPLALSSPLPAGWLSPRSLCGPQQIPPPSGELRPGADALLLGAGFPAAATWRLNSSLEKLGRRRLRKAAASPLNPPETARGVWATPGSGMRQIYRGPGPSPAPAPPRAPHSSPRTHHAPGPGGLLPGDPLRPPGVAASGPRRRSPPTVLGLVYLLRATAEV